MIFKILSIVLLNTLFSDVLSFTDVCNSGELRVEREPKYLTSPNWPSNYDNNLDCYKTLNAGKNQRVAFSLVEAQFESTAQMYDYVELYDGLQRTTRMTYFTALSSDNLMIVTSTNQYMIVRFISDGDTTQKGFKAKVYSIIDVEKAVLELIYNVSLIQTNKKSEEDLIKNLSTSFEVRFNDLSNNIAELRNETIEVIKNNEAKNETENEKLKEEMKSLENKTCFENEKLKEEIKFMEKHRIKTNSSLQSISSHFEIELNKTSNFFNTELESRNEILTNFSKNLNSLTSRIKDLHSVQEAKFNSSENFENQTETRIQYILKYINRLNQNQIYDYERFVTFEGNMTLTLQEMRSDFIVNLKAKKQSYLSLTILTILLVSFLCLFGVCKRFGKNISRNPSPPIMVNNDIYNL